jgi:hypothetical protein
MLPEVVYQVNLTSPDVDLPESGLFKPDPALIDEQSGLLFEIPSPIRAVVDPKSWILFGHSQGSESYPLCL